MVLMALLHIGTYMMMQLCKFLKMLTQRQLLVEVGVQIVIT